MEDAAGMQKTDETPILQPGEMNPEETPSPGQEDTKEKPADRRKTKHRERAPAEKKSPGPISDIAGFLLHLAIVIAAVWAIFTFIFGVSIARGETMYPRIRDGDVLFSYRMQRDIRTGDVLAVKKDGREFIGRVVAVGGETVDITPLEEQLLTNRLKNDWGLSSYPAFVTARTENGEIIIDNFIQYDQNHPMLASDIEAWLQLNGIYAGPDQ